MIREVGGKTDRFGTLRRTGRKANPSVESAQNAVIMQLNSVTSTLELHFVARAPFMTLRTRTLMAQECATSAPKRARKVPFRAEVEITL